MRAWGRLSGVSGIVSLSRGISSEQPAGRDHHMDLGLRDKVAFIAGSSRGIGFAIARAFLREGARVIVTGTNADALQQALATLVGEASPERVYSVRGDMTAPADIQRALDEGAAAVGGSMSSWPTSEAAQDAVGGN